MHLSRRAPPALLLSLLLQLAAACGGGGGERVQGCTADGQCASGARCLSGACQYPYQLTIVKPSGRLVTSRPVEIQVSAAGGPVGGPVWQPGSVEVLVGDQSIATVGPPDYATRWLPDPGQDGTYMLRARVTTGGQSYESLPVPVVIDREPPAPPALTATPGSPRSSRAVTLVGTAEAGATLEVRDGSAAAPIAGVVVPAGGAFTAQVSLDEGAHDLALTATDEAGNTSAASAVAVVVDLTPPPPPSLHVDSPTAADPVVVTGTAEQLSRVQVTADGTVLGTADATSTGDWRFEAGLSSGSHALSATATDLAGNTSVPCAAAQVTVARAAPTTPTVVAAPRTSAQPVPLWGTADTGTVVRVFEGTAELARAVADAVGQWRASADLAEGSHALWARSTSATGVESAASPAFTVVVDRTRPVVVSRAPAPGATNVWSRDPITVTFSEPIDPDSLPGNVQLGASSGSAPLHAISLSGSTLTVALGERPSVPNHLTVQLGSGIRDLAGNALVVPSDAWSWDVPVWQTLPLYTVNGTSSVYFRLPDMAAGPGAQIIRSYLSPMAIPANVVFADQWIPPSWSPTGAACTFTTQSDFSLAVSAAGVVHVACAESGVVRVSALGGAGWTRIGGDLNADPTAKARSPRLRLDAAGVPVVAWVEPADRSNVILARRWDGGAWQPISSSLTPWATGATIGEISLALDAAGLPVIAWVESSAAGSGVKVARPWDAGWYRASSDPGTALTAPSIAVDALNQPVVAAWDASAGGVVVFASNMRPSPGPWNTDWTRVGAPLPSASAVPPQLAIHPDGTLLLAHAQGASLYVRAWDAASASWVARGGDLASGAAGVWIDAIRLSVARDGHTAVAWMETAAVSGRTLRFDVHVAHYNR
jgi:hypothetical protein